METGIALDVVKKYEKIRYIPKEYKDIIDSLGLGHQALLALDRMRNRLPSTIFYRIVDVLKLKSPNIFGYHVEAIEYLTKVDEFRKLPESSIVRCVNKTIIHKTFKQKEAEDIVNVEAVILGLAKNDAAFERYFDYVISEAHELDRIISTNLIRKASPSIRRELVAIFENCLERVKTNYWRRT